MRTLFLALAFTLAFFSFGFACGDGDRGVQPKVEPESELTASSLLSSVLISMHESTLMFKLWLFELVDAFAASQFNDPVPIPTINNLGLPTIAEAQYYTFFAGAVYCFGSRILKSWTCDHCKATGPNVRLVTTLFNHSTQVAGMININHVDKKIIITFRGSYAIQNFVVDTFLRLVPFSDVNEDVLVHEGFLLYANSIYPQVRNQTLRLAAKHRDYHIVVVGHSLGSALAMLIILRLVTTEPQFALSEPSKFALFSYGGPRVGNVAFAQWANSLAFTAVRVTHYADEVPHIPHVDITSGVQQIHYAHFATEFWIEHPCTSRTRICSSSVTEDPTCSDSLAPDYTWIQHLWYYNVSMVQCLIEDPIHSIRQII